MSRDAEVKGIRSRALIHKKKHLDSLNGYPARHAKPQRPFWMPAASFYVLTLAVASGVFFVVLGLFREDGAEPSIIFAGISASVVLGGSVFLREVVLRRARNRVIETQRRLDRTLKAVPFRLGSKSGRPDKLSLELNAVILREIKRKSEAARILDGMSNGHREVYELCERYLSVNGRELAQVGVGSPRLASLLKGKELAAEFHRYHMLRWAEIEAKALSLEARNSSKATARIDAVQRALSVVSLALVSYPDEPNLHASGEAIREFLSSIKLSDRIEKAERAVSRGNFEQGRKRYAEALRFLTREDIPDRDREFAASKINEALDQIDKLEP